MFKDLRKHKKYKRENMKHTDHYKPPFKLCSSYIFSSNNTMSLMFCSKLSEESKENIVDKLNGEGRKLKKKLSLSKDDPTVIQCEGKDIMLIRGWGSLIGGSLNLDEEKAEKIQDEFGQWVIETLNN